MLEIFPATLEWLFLLPTAHPISSCVYSDASGSYGCGAFAEGVGWFKVEWPEDWLKVGISAKKLVPVVVASAIWGKLWAGKHICFHADNMAVVAVLNSRTAKDPILMHSLRCFSFYSAYFRLHFSAVHIPGVMNTAANALSRNNLFSCSSDCTVHYPTISMSPAGQLGQICS